MEILFRLSVKGEKFEVTLPKPKTRTDTVVFLGVIQKVDPGYVQVDFKGTTLRGSTFATATNLMVGGTSTQSMNYVGDFSYYWGAQGGLLSIWDILFHREKLQNGYTMR